MCTMTMVELVAIATLLLGFQQQVSASCKFDFEEGPNSLRGWTRTGDAFNTQPTFDDNPAARGLGTPVGLQGNWWIGTYEDRPSKGTPAGMVQTDFPRGTLTSPNFVITGDDINFLIGGGCDKSKARVELLVNGVTKLRTSSPRCGEKMHRVHWKVHKYRGKLARVRLVDDSSWGWGHLNFDDLRGDIRCLDKHQPEENVKQKQMQEEQTGDYTLKKNDDKAVQDTNLEKPRLDSPPSYHKALVKDVKRLEEKFQKFVEMNNEKRIPATLDAVPVTPKPVLSEKPVEGGKDARPVTIYNIIYPPDKHEQEKVPANLENYQAPTEKLYQKNWRKIADAANPMTSATDKPGNNEESPISAGSDQERTSTGLVNINAPKDANNLKTERRIKFGLGNQENPGTVQIQENNNHNNGATTDAMSQEIKIEQPKKIHHAKHRYSGNKAIHRKKLQVKQRLAKKLRGGSFLEAMVTPVEIPVAEETGSKDIHKGLPTTGSHVSPIVSNVEPIVSSVGPIVSNVGLDHSFPSKTPSSNEGLKENVPTQHSPRKAYKPTEASRTTVTQPSERRHDDIIPEADQSGPWKTGGESHSSSAPTSGMTTSMENDPEAIVEVITPTGASSTSTGARTTSAGSIAPTSGSRPTGMTTSMEEDPEAIQTTYSGKGKPTESHGMTTSMENDPEAVPTSAGSATPTGSESIATSMENDPKAVITFAGSAASTESEGMTSMENDPEAISAQRRRLETRANTGTPTRNMRSAMTTDMEFDPDAIIPTKSLTTEMEDDPDGEPTGNVTPTGSPATTERITENQPTAGSYHMRPSGQTTMMEEDVMGSEEIKEFSRPKQTTSKPSPASIKFYGGDVKIPESSLHSVWPEELTMDNPRHAYGTVSDFDLSDRGKDMMSLIGPIAEKAAADISREEFNPENRHDIETNSGSSSSSSNGGLTNTGGSSSSNGGSSNTNGGSTSNTGAGSNTGENSASVSSMPGHTSTGSSTGSASNGNLPGTGQMGSPGTVQTGSPGIDHSHGTGQTGTPGTGKAGSTGIDHSHGTGQTGSTGTSHAGQTGNTGQSITPVTGQSPSSSIDPHVSVITSQTQGSSGVPVHHGNNPEQISVETGSKAGAPITITIPPIVLPQSVTAIPNLEGSTTDGSQGLIPLPTTQPIATQTTTAPGEQGAAQVGTSGVITATTPTFVTTHATISTTLTTPTTPSTTPTTITTIPTTPTTIPTTASTVMSTTVTTITTPVETTKSTVNIPTTMAPNPKTELRNLNCKIFLVAMRLAYPWNRELMFSSTPTYENLRHIIEERVLAVYGEELNFLGIQFGRFSRSSEDGTTKAYFVLRFNSNGAFLAKLIDEYGQNTIYAAGCYDPAKICPANCPESCAPACTPSCCSAGLPKIITAAPPLSKCPGSCLPACAPGCNPLCCSSTSLLHQNRIPPNMVIVEPGPPMQDPSLPGPILPDMVPLRVAMGYKKSLPCPRSCDRYCKPNCPILCCRSNPFRVKGKKVTWNKYTKRSKVARRKNRQRIGSRKHN
ncbi:mucin-5AC isoform X2 [Nematostella vectensis]|uniref:mucin-5AC isoform X2 n=1 Tax=Nematostella vectensis TaxID=45351 RepID=UPI0020770FA5|nr:mucin-5AC isoform X2 [Nematostella vectensis]